MTTHPSAFGLTVSPVKTRASVNTNHTVTVYDQGHKPLVITMSAQEIVRNASTGKCEVSPHAATWATVTPTRFTLQPGTHRTTTLHITGTPAPGEHDLAAWATTPTGTTTHGAVTLHTNGSLGSQFLVTIPGNVPLTAPAPCVSIAAPPAPAGLLTPTTLAAGVSGLFLVMLVVAFLVRRMYVKRPPAVPARRRSDCPRHSASTPGRVARTRARPASAHVAARSRRPPFIRWLRS
jgi:hypothetical protein